MSIPSSGPAGARGPDAGGGRGACVVAEVAWLAAEGALNAVGQVGVAAVEDLAEQVGEQVDPLVRHALLGGSGAELGDGDGHVADLAAHRLGDLPDGLLKRQQPGAGSATSPAST